MAGSFVSWDPKLEVGIPTVDEQHRRLIEITNDLFTACLSGKEETDRRFRIIIREAVEYVNTHFRDEERLMLDAGYPWYAEHKLKHEDFVKQIIASVKQYDSGKLFVPNAFVRFLRDWLWEHIAVVDRAFARYYLRT